jgi:DNA-binding response OmpR family regulator
VSAAPPARILVVEDDRTTADLVALYLRHAGHRVRVEHTGDGALVRLGEETFDLLVLDVMLPGADGLEICRAVRAEGATPIILLTARTREDDRVQGLELGADDYVTKPFSPRELVARAHAVLRRAPPGGSEPFRCGELEVDVAAHLVRRGGETVALTPTEFGLLAALVRRPGHVLTRRQLLDALPGERLDTLDRAVDVHVRNLRRKLERDPSRPRWVLTVPGVGYRFAAEAGT